MKMNLTYVLTPLLLLVTFQFALAENWPQWRGPDNNGVAADGVYPRRFSSDDHDWKVALPGRGCSTPVVWGEKIFVTCGIDGRDGVVCYDFEGNELWRQSFDVERPGKHRNASGSNPSPVTDGQHLVVYYKSGTIACLNHDGQVQWHRNLQEDFGEDRLWWDIGSSPVIAGSNAVIVVFNAGGGFLVALDLADGEDAWKQDRTYQTAVESDQGYTTPSVHQRDGRNVIVTAGADHVTVHDAETGSLQWERAGLNPNNQGMWRMIASPVLGDDAVIVPYGRGAFLTAVRLDGSDTIWDKKLQGSEVPTPIVVDGRIILLGDAGHVSCRDVTTGDELWAADVPGSQRNKFYSSPVLAGNTLYCAREDGVVITCEINDGLTLIAENDLGEQLIASPVAVRNKMLMRGSEHLFLFGPTNSDTAP